MRKFICLLSTLSLCLVMGGCSFKLSDYNPLSLFGEDKQEQQQVVQEEKNEVDDFNSKIEDPVAGKEDKLFIFKAPKVKKKPADAKPAESIREVKLYLSDGIYYTIELPFDLDVITDNSTYIYALDNSLSVQVVSNVPWDEFSQYVSIDDAVSLAPNLIISPEGKKGPQEAAMHIVNDKAVIVRTYDNPVAFATILKGLEEKTYRITNYTGMQVSKKKTEALISLPTYTGYHVTVNAGLSDDILNVYNYEEGTLTIAREFKTWDKAVEAVGTKLAVISNSNILDKYYTTDTICYMENDDYAVGLVFVNYNTTITLFGKGTEAKFNIIAFLNSYTTS